MDHASNIIIDHCSVEWGRWDDLGIPCRAMTHRAVLPHGGGINPQSFGALIDSVSNVDLEPQSLDEQ